MHIYFSGIGGVGLGPLAEIARDAGYDVSGSDTTAGLTTAELIKSEIDVMIYEQDGSALRALHERRPIDWFVYTSSLEKGLPELNAARELGIRTSKRDELLSHIITEKNLKLIAVAGTHGKTTTTGMLVWTMQALGIPVSYSVGTTLSFGPSGLFDPASEYFVYECDEYDRNFLAFEPHLSLITTVDHDHFDTYPTPESYAEAFRQFALQSNGVITWGSLRGLFPGVPRIDYQETADGRVHLTGELSRANGTLVLGALERLLAVDSDAIAAALSDFPGTNRRFGKLAPNLYSDYGHHPVEIAATLQMARERATRVVLVYQPHQNVRQHEIRDDYTANIFADADVVYWLPTYLTREIDGQAVLTPAELSSQLPAGTVIPSEFGDALWQATERERAAGALVLYMGAGPIDGWVRERAAALRRG
jgi:UDP-N-acetylmuramate--alanine ligase